MKSKRNYVLTLYAALICGKLIAQPVATLISTDLVDSDSFFQYQKKDINAYLSRQIPAAHLSTAAIKTESHLVTLQLMPDVKQACSVTPLAWAKAEQNNVDWQKKLLNHWAFLAEIDVTQAAIEVQCCKEKHFFRRMGPAIAGADVRTARGNEWVPLIKPLAFVEQEVTPKTSDDTELSTLLQQSKANEVTQKVRKFCEQKYLNLPKARYIWDAEMKFTEISDTEFQVEVTYISNVAISDGYFEYHKIYVTTQQTGNNAILNVRLLGKYGSGIIFAPRRNDYKDMEINYKHEIADFRQVFFKQIINAAQKP
jgi:hypothetical protein